MRYFRGVTDSRSHSVRLGAGEPLPARLEAICGAVCDPVRETGLTEAPKQVCRRCAMGAAALRAVEERGQT